MTMRQRASQAVRPRGPSSPPRLAEAREHGLRLNPLVDLPRFRVSDWREPIAQAETVEELDRLEVTLRAASRAAIEEHQERLVRRGLRTVEAELLWLGISDIEKARRSLAVLARQHREGLVKGGPAGDALAEHRSGASTFHGQSPREPADEPTASTSATTPITTRPATHAWARLEDKDTN